MLGPEQMPPVQVSGNVQMFPSSQTVPSGAAGFEQTPVPGLQVPATWHWSNGVQTPVTAQSACTIRGGELVASAMKEAPE